MASPRTWARERRLLLEFAAGFSATLLFHQPVLWMLHRAGVTPRSPYAMTPVPPFGIPSVISLAFWGGVWGLILIPVIARVRGEAAYYAAAIAFGAVAPTLVAAFIIAPMRHKPLPHGLSALLIGFLINGAWGLGTALLFRFFARSR
jgi:hypothetical protein